MLNLSAWGGWDLMYFRALKVGVCDILVFCIFFLDLQVG